MAEEAVVVLFGGPAGAGKSTLAAAWCAGRERAVHIELDAIRSLIVSPHVDPQQQGALQSEQYDLSVRACCRLARAFLDAGYDVTVDDVLEPAAFERVWRPQLRDLSWRLLVVLPGLEATIERGRARPKRVREDLVCAQHEASSAWPEALRLDTTGLSVAESLDLAGRRGLLPA